MVVALFELLLSIRTGLHIGLKPQAMPMRLRGVYGECSYADRICALGLKSLNRFSNGSRQPS